MRERFCAGTSGATEERVRAGVGAGVTDEARAMIRFAAVRAVERVLVVRFGLATEPAPRVAGRLLAVFAAGFIVLLTVVLAAGLIVRLTVVFAAGLAVRLTVVFAAGLAVRLTVVFAAGLAVR